jgi:hypothetical protein
MINYAQHILEVEELKKEIAKLKKRTHEAEGETSIVKGIGMNSPEFLALKKRVKELDNSLLIALEINDNYQRENKELKEDNKKLAMQIEDKDNLVGKLRGKGLL